MSFLNELKRRNVLRVTLVYLAGSWLLIQILETLFPIYGLDETSIQIVVAIIAIGFVPLFFASLVPYIVVGVLLASIMLLSWLTTLILLTALIAVGEKYGRR